MDYDTMDKAELTAHRDGVARQLKLMHSLFSAAYWDSPIPLPEGVPPEATWTATQTDQYAAMQEALQEADDALTAFSEEAESATTGADSDNEPAE